MNKFFWMLERLLLPKDRMKLTLKDMPKYKGEIECLVGERRDHYPDGTHKSRQQKPGEEK